MSQISWPYDDRVTTNGDVNFRDLNEHTVSEHGIA
jgi:hypothetical protein